ncbi:MAG: response regulator, partial [Candidatus Aminicenantes bacterium]|nr:response regulator [Candidatus Aminicenantes bacterium]
LRMKDKPVILVVDDEPQNIDLLEAYLVPQGYEIVKAANGEEALGKLSGNQIDLILLDVLMPGIDGFEVTRRVRQDNTHRLLPIILVTVLRDTEDRVKGIEAGCDDFISSPVDKMELLARVRSLLKVKAYNDLISNYRKELEAANKELEAFTYTVSHDLHAPLRAVVGFTRILLDEHAPHLPPEVQRYLNLVRSNTLQMGRLVDDLLAFSRFSRQAMIKSQVNPAALVREALNLLRSEQEGRNVKITVGDLPVCQGDRALLKQVFVNLLSNALKFTRKRDPAVIEVGCIRKDGENVFFVRDNGVGFDMRYVGKLFGVFQRLHRSEDYEGTGLGLAIVQRIVHRHGGRVWAEAVLDKGATFNFTLKGESP